MSLLRFVRPRIRSKRKVETPADVLYPVLESLRALLGKPLFNYRRNGLRAWGYRLRQGSRDVGRVIFFALKDGKGKAELRFHTTARPLLPLSIPKFKGWFSVNPEGIKRIRKKETQKAKEDYNVAKARISFQVAGKEGIDVDTLQKIKRVFQTEIFCAEEPCPPDVEDIVADCYANEPKCKGYDVTVILKERRS